MCVPIGTATGSGLAAAASCLDGQVFIGHPVLPHLVAPQSGNTEDGPLGATMHRPGLGSKYPGLAGGLSNLETEPFDPLSGSVRFLTNHV